MFVNSEGDQARGRAVCAELPLWQDTLGQTGAGLAADGDGNGVVGLADYGCRLWFLAGPPQQYRRREGFRCGRARTILHGAPG